MTPNCFDSDQQYAFWIQSDTYTNGKVKLVHDLCQDCTPCFAMRMRNEGRCDHPQVIFERHGDEWIGKMPAPEQEKFASQYAGVSRAKGRNKWVAQIYREGKRHYVGYFDTELEASQAYESAKRMFEVTF